MLRSISIICIILISGALISAEGENSINDYLSPLFLSGGSSITSLESPASDVLNPAASGAKQRIVVDLSYIGIIGSGTSATDGTDVSGYKGHAINLGNTLPTRAGVFSWSAHFLTSAYDELSTGTHVGANFSFAKDLYYNLLVGAGISGGIGGGYNNPLYWNLAADLGFIHFPGDIGFLQDFRWGITLNQLGFNSTMLISDSPYAVVLPFSIVSGVSAAILTTDDIQLNMAADLIFPAVYKFDNIKFALGAEFRIKDMVSINTASRIDLKELISGDLSSLIPSLGVSVTIKTDFSKDDDFLNLTEKGWNKSEIRIRTGAAPIEADLWGIGAGINIPLGVIDTEAPKIEIDFSGFNFDPLETDETETDEAEIDETETDEAETDETVSDKSDQKDITTGNNVKSFPRKDRKNVDTRTNSTETAAGNAGISIVAYISPNNDGILDDFSFPFKIKDTRFIKGYNFIIQDSEGKAVKTITNKEQREENDNRNFFERFFDVKTGIEIPETLRWDGSLDDGTIAEDGLYSFFIEAWDDNGNVGKSESAGIVIDNTPPSISIDEINSVLLIISPNGDGNKDALQVTQTGSVEDLWNGVIKDSADQVYKNFSWINSEPESFNWNGKNNDEVLSPDGVYNFSITSTDRAGNSFESGIKNILINTEITPITIAIDVSWFSPNNNGKIDTVTFTPNIPVKDGIEYWELGIANSSGMVVRKYSGISEIPETIVFNGLSDFEDVLPEGKYYSTLKVRYINGNFPIEISPEINIDVKPPSVSVKSDFSIFSPNGDGKKDFITFHQETSVEDLWIGTISDSNGVVIKEYSWVEAADPRIRWDGRGIDGQLQTDGNYRYILTSTDRAGNTGISEEMVFQLNTEETPVILGTEFETFSPNSDGVKDTIRILPEIKVTTGISSYILNILTEDGSIIKAFSGNSSLSDPILWDGLSDLNEKAPDGKYRASIKLVYTTGNEPEALSESFIIDTSFPEISVSTSLTLFSPDDDGKKDTVVLSHLSSNETLWTGRILSPKNSIVRQVYWKGIADEYIWDGTDEAGNVVPDGKYKWEIDTSDAAGNYRKAIVDEIVVDTRPVKVFVTTGLESFSPNGNGYREEIIFTPYVNIKEGISSWSFHILYKNGDICKSFSGTTQIPSSIIWDGKNNEDKIIEDSYTATFSVVYNKGNEPFSITSPFLLDVSPPVCRIEVFPVPFSPDNDGYDDDLTILMDVSDESPVESWSFIIRDPENNVFKSYSGNDLPGNKIIWNGLSDTGELVYSAEDYSYTMIIEDNLGNRNEKEGVIPVDILVIRDGNLLRIQIANITFAPNSHELISDKPEAVSINEYVLSRIAEILKKYSTYRIRIEGHAVNLSWADKTLAEKEEKEELSELSEARANTVKDKLMQLGVPGIRINIVGMGGTNPIVPHGDIENRWKNRRVEFILEK